MPGYYARRADGRATAGAAPAAGHCFRQARAGGEHAAAGCCAINSACMAVQPCKSLRLCCPLRSLCRPLRFSRPSLHLYNLYAGVLSSQKAWHSQRKPNRRSGPRTAGELVFLASFPLRRSSPVISEGSFHCLLRRVHRTGRRPFCPLKDSSQLQKAAVGPSGWHHLPHGVPAAAAARAITSARIHVLLDCNGLLVNSR